MMAESPKLTIVDWNVSMYMAIHAIVVTAHDRVSDLVAWFSALNHEGVGIDNMV